MNDKTYPPQGWKLIKDSTHAERSWPDDVTSGRSLYSCCCAECGRNFDGSKRRACCRVCAETPPQITEAQAERAAALETNCAANAMLRTVNRMVEASNVGDDALVAMAEQIRAEAERMSREATGVLIRSKTQDAASQPTEMQGEDAKNAARWQALVAQHEIDDDQASDCNYGRTYPKRTLCVFQGDGEDGLAPIPCDPGALTKVVDAILASSKTGGA